MISFPDLVFWQLILCAIVTLLAAFTKGVTGFAMPIIMVSGMAMFLDPKLAIASIVIPTMVANIWQATQNGWHVAIETFKKHALLICTTLTMIFINAQWIGILNFNLLLTLLGVVITGVSLIQILGFTIQIRPDREKLGAFITGQIAGFFGALSGTWGPPTMIYLIAVNTPKVEQVRVAGLTFGLGALVFWIAHQRSGLVTPEALGLSILMLIPMALGLFLGNKAQAKIDQVLFRKVTLWVLLFAGLNVLRKAVMG